MKICKKSTQINNRKARYYCLSSTAKTSKPTLHFYGGNGFPVGVYEPLLKALGEHFNIVSLAMQGYWHDLTTAKVLTREQDRDFLIEFLEKTQDQPIIGVGHSQGATATAMAAAKRPDLFSTLYLIDPVTFTNVQTKLFKLIPRSVLKTKEPFKSTRYKQTDWHSIEEYYQHLRQHRAFKRISNDNLLTFAENSLIKATNNMYSLVFPPQQELASYFGVPFIDPALKQLNKLKLPYHLILAKPSVFNSTKVRKGWRGFVDKAQITTLSNYGHLLPMEAPTTCAELITDLYKRHPKNS